jgi:hypothetical protein
VADRVLDPEEQREGRGDDRVQALAGQQRDEEAAETDFDEEQPVAAAAHFQELIGLTDRVLGGDDLDVALAAEGLSFDERDALRMLQQVVRGGERDGGEVLLAERRLEMLNHVLAVLQPTLAMALTPELVEMRDQYDEVVEEIVELRERLERQDAVEEELAGEEAQGGDADQDDEPDEEEEEKEEKRDTWAKRVKAKPKPKPGPPRPKPPPLKPGESTLYGKPGEPAVDQPAAPSALYGKPGEPAVEQPAAPSALYGKPGEPAVDKPAAPSALYDEPAPAAAGRPAVPSVWDPADVED